MVRIRLTIGFTGFVSDCTIEHPSSTGCGVLYRDMGVLIIGMSPVSSGEGTGPVLVDPAARQSFSLLRVEGISQDQWGG